MSSLPTDPSPMPLRVALAAGGTGGHLMPALATAEALTARVQCQFLVIGSQRTSERALRGLVPYPVVEVKARGMVGTGFARRLRALATVPGSVATARSHLSGFRPHLVIATGGYVCGPSGLAAWLAGIPLLVLEQNADPGLTTRWLRPFARAIAVSFEETAHRIGYKAVLTGNPVRASLPSAPRRDGSATDAHRNGVHLLILGGSQGAHGLNMMTELAIPILASAQVGLKITHQAGQTDLDALRETYDEHGIPATVTPFIQNIGEAYAQADLVCGRAGATTIAELTYCGLPSILVPFPSAAGRHQHSNARALQRAGAAMVVEESHNGHPLAETILGLAADADRRAEMAAAAAACGSDAAAAVVADLALSLIDASAPLSDMGTPTTSSSSTSPKGPLYRLMDVPRQ